VSPAGRLAWPLLCLLVEAAHAIAGPAPRCVGPEVASLPLLRAGALSAVPVALDGHPASLIVDTGATHLALSGAVARSLGLPATWLRASVASGIGGALSRQLVDLRELDLDGIRIPARNIPVLGLEMPPVEDGAPAAGVLGASVLSRFDVEMDFPDRRLRLFLHAACEIDRPPWQGTWSRLPVDFEPSNLDGLLHHGDVESFANGLTVYRGEPHPNRARLFTVVRVNGTALVALIDSGAALSTLSPEAAARLGAKPLGDGVLMVGADDRPVQGKAAVVSSVAVGQDVRSGVVLGVAPLDLGRADMLLGHDLMLGRRVFISFETGSMFWGEAPRGPSRPVR
jgi:predicted aspartyl protease